MTTHITLTNNEKYTEKYLDIFTESKLTTFQKIVQFLYKESQRMTSEKFDHFFKDMPIKVKYMIEIKEESDMDISPLKIREYIFEEYYEPNVSILKKITDKIIESKYDRIVRETDEIGATVNKYLIRSSDFTKIVAHSKMFSKLKNIIKHINYGSKNYMFNYKGIKHSPIKNYEIVDTSRKIYDPVIIDNNLISYTFDLLKHIPLSDDIIFTGGSLFDIVCDTSRINDFMDLDIFVLKNGDEETIIQKIIDNLVRNGGKTCYAYKSDSIHYIFIEDVPRLIQVIFTNFNTAEKLVNNFDSTHLKMFYNGKDIYINTEAIQSFISNTSIFCGDKTLRLFKILMKGLRPNVIKPLRKDNMFRNAFHKYDKTFSKYCDTVDKDVTNFLQICTELDYNKIVSDKSVVQYIERRKFYDVTNIGYITNMYNLDASQLVIFHKYCNPLIFKSYFMIKQTPNQVPINNVGPGLHMISQSNNLEKWRTVEQFSHIYSVSNFKILINGQVTKVSKFTSLDEKNEQVVKYFYVVAIARDANNLSELKKIGNELVKCNEYICERILAKYKSNKDLKYSFRLSISLTKSSYLANALLCYEDKVHKYKSDDSDNSDNSDDSDDSDAGESAFLYNKDYKYKSYDKPDKVNYIYFKVRAKNPTKIYAEGDTVTISCNIIASGSRYASDRDLYFVLHENTI